MLPRPIRALLYVLTLALSACTAASTGPREYLDEKTAATVTTASQPIVFAHERPELAAHSREYVTLAAATVNRGGALECYLFVYRWSTVDRRGAFDSALATDELTIAADGRQIRPQLVGHSPADAGVGSALSAPPKHHWKLDIYRADPAMLRFLGAASQMAIVTETPEGHITYELWDDQRRALLALVQRLEGRD